MTNETPSENGYTAIVMAGKRPGVDPAAAARGQTYKALIDINDQPMIARVLGALSNAPSISRIILVTEDALGALDDIPGVADAQQRLPVQRIRSAPTISASVLAAIASRPEGSRFLIATADHPLLTPEIIDAFTSQTRNKAGVSVALVERETIEAAYPQVQRTYLRFRKAALSGANLFAVNDRSGLNAIRFWENIEANRKRPWKLAAAFGPLNLAGFMFKLFSVDTAFKRAGRLLDCPVHAIRLPFANAAIDVDKPSDIELVEKILAAR